MPERRDSIEEHISAQQALSDIPKFEQAARAFLNGPAQAREAAQKAKKAKDVAEVVERLAPKPTASAKILAHITSVEGQREQAKLRRELEDQRMNARLERRKAEAQAKVDDPRTLAEKISDRYGIDSADAGEDLFSAGL
jgi:hypothetical protein